MTLYICKYNNKHNISQDYGQSVYVALYSRFTWQCNCFVFITYYIKKCLSWQHLASMSFFKRSGTYNVYCFGSVWYKNDVEKKKKKHMGTHVYMQASDCIINYLNKNKFLLSYLQSVIRFCTLTSKNAIFIFFFFWRNKLLGYKVGKLFCFHRVVFEFYTL